MVDSIYNHRRAKGHETQLGRHMCYIIRDRPHVVADTQPDLEQVSGDVWWVCTELGWHVYLKKKHVNLHIGTFWSSLHQRQTIILVNATPYTGTKYEVATANLVDTDLALFAHWSIEIDPFRCRCIGRYGRNGCIRRVQLGRILRTGITEEVLIILKIDRIKGFILNCYLVLWRVPAPNPRLIFGSSVDDLVRVVSPNQTTLFL